mgnify:CR=1 FL=1
MCNIAQRGKVMRIKLTKDQVDAAFAGVAHQADYFIALYHAVMDAAGIRRGTELADYPRISNRGWVYICERAIKSDQKLHPDVMAGGLWMNRGFSADDLQVFDDGWEVAVPSVA